MKLPNWIIEWLSWSANEVVRKRPVHDFTVGGSDNPYMYRWWVIPRNKVFNIYLHRFLRSDSDEALHDHPWAFNISIIVKGEYTEHTKLAGGVERKRLFPTGTIKLRLGPAPHRVELTAGEVWTFFITGPTIREWGFHCPKGWRPWKEFVASHDGGNTVGRGCGD